ncbi:MAG: tRNA (adenosine(37)-N6)-threonylcarbamoyltransferase complex ATPase subunit type 1 TsaE [Bdellovibrionota bacterium]
MIINSLEDLKQWLKKNLIAQLTPKTLVLLEGEMGVGKTQMVKLFCEQFGCYNEVSSPTFAIIQEYPSALGVIHHADLYRIESNDELENTGFWEIFNKSPDVSKGGVIFIEWSQKMDISRIPKGWKIIRIKYEFADASSGSRKIELSLL